MIGALLTLRFGVSCVIGGFADVFVAVAGDEPFTKFAEVVDDDLRIADCGRDGGLSFLSNLCGLFGSVTEKLTIGIHLLENSSHFLDLK